MQIPCAERRVYCADTSTATEHAAGTATEHRGTASGNSQLFYVDVDAGFV